MPQSHLLYALLVSPTPYRIMWKPKVARCDSLDTFVTSNKSSHFHEAAIKWASQRSFIHLQACADGPNPGACVACLTAPIEDTVKDDLCEECAMTEHPWECNRCLASANEDVCTHPKRACSFSPLTQFVDTGPIWHFVSVIEWFLFFTVTFLVTTLKIDCFSFVVFTVHKTSVHCMCLRKLSFSLLCLPIIWDWWWKEARYMCGLCQQSTPLAMCVLPNSNLWWEGKKIRMFEVRCLFQNAWMCFLPCI